MRRIFIDAGFYCGNTLKRYIREGIVDSSWEVYAFEPNPDLEIDKYLESIPVEVNLIKAAVWTANGYITFNVAGRHDAASIDGLATHPNPKKVRVKTINFPGFVASLPEAEQIICSMDIEGAEYRVLAKMIKDGSINRINTLEIEFHHRLLAEKSQEDSQAIIDELEKRGIEVILKVPLN